MGRIAERIADGLKPEMTTARNTSRMTSRMSLSFLGMIASSSFVCEPEDNGCAERFIRSLKENLLWVQIFETGEQLRLDLLEFKKNYNEQWIIQRLGYQTPSQARRNASVLRKK